MNTRKPSDIICQRIRLSGLVQGVGFRPLVARLAKELNLTGWIRKDAHGLEIEACGPNTALATLLLRIKSEAPPNARLDDVVLREQKNIADSAGFFILESRSGRSTTMIGQDTVVCRDCLREMFDPENRRWRYAFTNCALCGPRYTLCNELPFDRERTSMKTFAMCYKCQTEYRRNHDRRAHADGNCCPKCGPQLALLNNKGEVIFGDVIANAYQMLKEGKIVAIKGTGCFHLFCDARNTEAVTLLRTRKNRFNKPFPIMFANALSATRYVQVSVGEPGLLNLPERPIVLLKKRQRCDTEFAKVAPELPWIGVVLPFSPIHYLIFHEAAGRPTHLDWLDQTQNFALLMSSANLGREPPAIDNESALQRLAGVADAFIVHDREIVTCCDDSIAYAGVGGLQLIRRARGYAPRAIKLPQAGPTILAFGDDSKSTICVTREDEAFVSQHMGDLLNPLAQANFAEISKHLLKILEVSPTLIAHDLNKNSYATQFAKQFATQFDLPTLGVQHHHAHIAAVLAEKNWTQPVIALALDGGGVGTDGKRWGGELLSVDGAHFERQGHLKPLLVAGNNQDLRTPWRLAAAVLHALGRDKEITTRFGRQAGASTIKEQLDTADHANTQKITSASYLYDAVAGLLGITELTSYRDRVGFLIEAHAERFGECAALAGGWHINQGQLDLLPLLAVLADEKNPERGAALFQATLAAALADWLCSATDVGDTVVIGGDCLQNQALARALRGLMQEQKRRLLVAQRIPTNNGGLSLGQAWIAQQYLLGWASR